LSVAVTEKVQAPCCESGPRVSRPSSVSDLDSVCRFPAPGPPLAAKATTSRTGRESGQWPPTAQIIAVAESTRKTTSSNPLRFPLFICPHPKGEKGGLRIPRHSFGGPTARLRVAKLEPAKKRQVPMVTRRPARRTAVQGPVLDHRRWPEPFAQQFQLGAGRAGVDRLRLRFSTCLRFAGDTPQTAQPGAARGCLAGWIENRGPQADQEPRALKGWHWQLRRLIKILCHSHRSCSFRRDQVETVEAGMAVMLETTGWPSTVASLWSEFAGLGLASHRRRSGPCFLLRQPSRINKRGFSCAVAPIGSLAGLCDADRGVGEALEPRTTDDSFDFRHDGSRHCRDVAGGAGQLEASHSQWEPGMRSVERTCAVGRFARLETLRELSCSER